MGAYWLQGFGTIARLQVVQTHLREFIVERQLQRLCVDLDPHAGPEPLPTLEGRAREVAENPESDLADRNPML